MCHFERVKLYSKNDLVFKIYLRIMFAAKMQKIGFLRDEQTI
jgi:hypothetical protein